MNQDILHPELLVTPGSLARIRVKPGSGCAYSVYPEFTALELESFLAECQTAINAARTHNAKTMRPKGFGR
jgi:hypothetical protein